MAFPTETVYGLGADATNPAAVERIFAAKGRPSTNPLIVHVADEEVAMRYAADWPEAARKLAARFWPGPLTLVVPRGGQIAPAVSAGLATVGLRCPDHPVALRLLRQFDGPIAAPSANRSTNVSPTTAEHVREELGSAVDLILDGGPCRVGIESTVLAIAPTPRILRPGGISREQIESVLGPVDMLGGFTDPAHPAASPGQHRRHYAPKAAAYRFEAGQRALVAKWRAEHRGQSWAVLVVGDDALPGGQENVIAMPADPAGYAHRLYSTLRKLDQQQVQTIWIEMPPDRQEWTAVRDRLRRATREFS